MHRCFAIQLSVIVVSPLSSFAILAFCKLP
jgi:hypothetical protein